METESILVDYSPRKRSHSQDSSGDELSVKRQNSQRYYYVLESESSIDSCSQETIYSIQDATTDWVQDTPDTISDSDPRMIEFELASSSSDLDLNNGFSCSSEPEDRWVNPVEIGSSSNSSMDDCSSIDTPEYLCNPVKQVCFHCGVNATTHPQLTYCNKCFKYRKNFFPPRSKKRKQCRNMESQESITSPSTPSTVQSSTQSTLTSTQESTSQDPDADLLMGGYCKMCYINPQNSGFVHKRIVHILGCYNCSVKIWKTIGRCPVCNRKIENVSKMIIV